jgi:hypothetical protein
MEFCPWTDDKDVNLKDASDDDEDMMRNNDGVVHPRRVSAKQAFSNEERDKEGFLLQQQLSESQKKVTDLQVEMKSLLQDLLTKTNYIYCLQLELTRIQQCDGLSKENQNLKLVLQDECQRRMYAEHRLGLLEAENQKTS